MYWHELNEKRIGQLRTWLKDKKLIIVGNSIKLMESEYGQLIDSYGAVCRLGKGLTKPALGTTIGQRTDIWFSGMLRAGLYNKVNCGWKILTLSTAPTFDMTTPFVPINKALFQEDFQVYRDYFWSDGLEETRTYWSSLGFDSEIRPSQGLVCVDFFTRKVGHDSIDIIGFDFFSEKIVINGVSHSSWHMPTNVVPGSLPHGKDIERDTMLLLKEKNNFNIIPYH